MNVGDKFSSYEEFSVALAAYKQSVNNEFWIRDARSIVNQRKRFPETVKSVNESLKYYYMRLACIKGGRKFKSKNENSERQCSTSKQDCKATIFVHVSKCKQYLYVQELSNIHNHTSSKSYFTALSQQRLKLPDSVKETAKEYLKSGANKKIVLEKIRTDLGCKLTLKDLTNLSRKKASQRKKFQECVNMLKETYKCSDVEVLVDEQDIFKGLYFQDDRMKNTLLRFQKCYLLMQLTVW